MKNDIYQLNVNAISELNDNCSITNIGFSMYDLDNTLFCTNI
jgi:hypothetical protein